MWAGTREIRNAQDPSGRDLACECSQSELRLLELERTSPFQVRLSGDLPDGC